MGCPQSDGLHSLRSQAALTTTPSKSTSEGYTGKPLETSFDLQAMNYGARFYDSRQGRWWQRDPLAEAYCSTSPYTYVLNSPMKLLDPTGKFSVGFDPTTNEVSATAEDGETFLDLASQMNISATDLDGVLKNNGLSLGDIPIGSVDVSECVLENQSFNAGNKGSNCHGFATFGISPLAVSEMSRPEFSTSGFSKTDSPAAGDVAVFFMAGVYQYKGGPIVQADNVQAHSAIFVLKDASGSAQFLHRGNTKFPVSINSQSGIVQFFANPNNAYLGADAYSIQPRMNPNPTFFTK